MTCDDPAFSAIPGAEYKALPFEGGLRAAFKVKNQRTLTVARFQTGFCQR